MRNPPGMLEWMASLADPTRARLLRVLQEGRQLAVAELCEVLQLPQSTVSHHLRVLGEEGLVESQRSGTSRLYRISLDRQGPAAQKLWALLCEDLEERAAAAQDDARLDQVLASRSRQSQAFFATAARDWERLRTELFGRSFDLRALAALLEPDAVVADLGCGTGELMHALSPFVRTVLGVDSSKAMLEAAGRRLERVQNTRLLQGPLDALPLEDGSVDLAIAMLVLQHLALPDRALAEAARVLRPGGRLLVVDMQPHDREEYRQQMGHVWLGFSKSALERLLTDAGFERVAWRPLPPDPSAKGPSLFAASAHRPAAVARRRRSPLRNVSLSPTAQESKESKENA